MLHRDRLGSDVVPATVVETQCTPLDHGPLISVVWYGRNRVGSAKESVAALQAQSHGHFELIVEECDSTDGTLEVFQSAAVQDSRIKVFPGSAAVSGGQSLLNALRRCRGDYIAICPSEGHLLPGALEFAIGQLTAHPEIGGICATGFLLDGHGNSLEPVDIITLLFTSYRPFLPAGFFSRRALAAIGIDREGWLTESLDLDICCRLAIDHGFLAVSQEVIASRDQNRQPDGLPRDIEKAIEQRLQLVSKFFSAKGFFGSDCGPLAVESKANQLAVLWHEFQELGINDIDAAVRPHMAAIATDFASLLRVDHRTLRSLHRLTCTRSHGLGLLSSPLQKLLAYSTQLSGRMPIHIGYAVWNTFLGSWLRQKVIARTLPRSDFDRSAPERASMFVELYAMAMSLHETRGQIELALEMSERTRPPNNMSLDSLASQAMLKLPSVTDEKIATFQHKWVRRHIGDQPVVTLATPNIRDSERKIRIGYHSSAMDGDTIHYMMRNVMIAHDRSRFEIYGYSPVPFSDELKTSFDVFRDTSIPEGRPDSVFVGLTPTMSDNEFVELVRRDEIDVFVEMTGFSIGHRFVAMSRRCAPVQVSFLNHTGSSHVPNVDYILADEIGIPSDSTAQSLYSERIYRMPGCFFCFDYRNSDYPPLVEPPSLNRPTITFGCFGSGGKINSMLIDLWSRLLHRVPNAVLRLQNGQLESKDNRRFMADRFRQFGIGPDRLQLKKGVGRRKLLDAYSEVDISLDTWPYCGGNTIAESFWMGVPVVTLKGDRFGSRYGASLVKAGGCADLIAESPEEYIDIAARLATDLPRLRYLRQNLRRMSIDHGLGDSTLFARRMENAYREMLGRQEPAPSRPSHAAAPVLATPRIRA
jgi:predicted O-linked N-acetylglucosamine transferase (SPINDLY family)/glycosyltransferase involved in cell wall biosynthesis